MKNHLNILALEGCQGVGKSTLLKRLAGGQIAHKFPLLSQIERPRTFKHLDNGAGLSLITDMLWYTSAVQDWFISPSATPKLIDRFIVSQWVYGKLRTDNDIRVSFDDIGRLNDSIDEFLYAFMPRINQEFRRRMVKDVPYLAHTNLIYLFILPDINTITYQRKFSKKVYDFAVIEEHAIYSQAFTILDARKDITCICFNGTESIYEIAEKINETFLSFSS